MGCVPLPSAFPQQILAGGIPATEGGSGLHRVLGHHHHQPATCCCWLLYSVRSDAGLHSGRTAEWQPTPFVSWWLPLSSAGSQPCSHSPGILGEFYLVLWDSTFYTIRTYVFPVITRLAHSNSCLNPVLCGLLRRQPQQVLSSAFRDPWSRLWPQSQACVEEVALKEVSGRWAPREWTNTKGHLDEGCSLDVPFSELYRGQNPQILGRSCALCQSVGFQGKSDL